MVIEVMVNGGAGGNRGDADKTPTMVNGEKGSPDLSGKRFGKLTVRGDSGLRSRSGNRLWWCRCDCGGTSAVSKANLLRGLTKSCGCLRREGVAARNRARTGKRRSAVAPRGPG